VHRECSIECQNGSQPEGAGGEGDIIDNDGAQAGASRIRNRVLPTVSSSGVAAAFLDTKDNCAKPAESDEEDFSQFKSPGGVQEAFAKEEDFSAFKSPGGVEKFKEPAPSSVAPKLTAKERFDLLGRTAMINACGEGDHVLVQQLLDAGAPVNAVPSCLIAALC
jgi:hypothetical protein